MALAQAQPGRASPSPGPAWPRSGQDLPGRDFPDLRFFAEVRNCPRRSRGGRESAPGGRESTVWGVSRTNPSWAGIFPTSANFQRSGESLPSLNLPDPPDGPSQPRLWKPDQSWGGVQGMRHIERDNDKEVKGMRQCQFRRHIQLFIFVRFPIEKMAVHNTGMTSPT